MARLFTLAQARRSLPGIAAVVNVMRKRALRLDELSALSASMRRSTSADGDPVVRDDASIQAEMTKLEGQIATLIEHIQQQGVEVKDIRRGLVDWRAERDGRGGVSLLAIRGTNGELVARTGGRLRRTAADHRFRVGLRRRSCRTIAAWRRRRSATHRPAAVDR